MDYIKPRIIIMSFYLNAKMKKLTLLLLLVASTTFGQFRLPMTYEAKMDSIAISRISLTFNRKLMQPTGLMVWRPEKWVKITIKPMVNNFAMMGAEECGDYFNVTKYDIRLKFYITKKWGWVNRWLLNGASDKKYIYQTGISLKF